MTLDLDDLQGMLADLSSLLLARRAELPAVQAAFLIVDRHDGVLYVGETKDMKARLIPTRSISQLLRRDPQARILWIEGTDVRAHDLTRRFTPAFQP